MPTNIDISFAVTLLRRGDVVAFATETVYGLGADAHSARGVQQIYDIKGRPAGHPLIIHVSNQAAACYWADLGAAGKVLADAFWPGPLTLIVPRRADVPAYACGDESTIGLRCPSHPLAHKLLAAFEYGGGRGIAAPSANRFGGVSPTSASHVRSDFGEVVPVLDGGPSDHGLESTIVDLSRGFVSILRPGSVTAAQVSEVLRARGLAAIDTEVNAQPSLRDKTVRQPRVSGSLAAHYAPDTAIELLLPEQLKRRVVELSDSGRRYVVCSSSQPEPPGLHWEHASSDAAVFGFRLYAMLREFDQLGADVILIEAPPRSAQWDAVNDRLQRAQTGSGLPARSGRLSGPDNLR
ncbi:MAG: L-threonylcarbamoyladenylate synthase [Burkholderiaceae bacterium]